MKTAEAIIEKMPVGSRLTNKELIRQVIDETHLPVSVASGLTVLAAMNCSLIKSRAGRDGGHFRIIETEIKNENA